MAVIFPWGKIMENSVRTRLGAAKNAGSLVPINEKRPLNARGTKLLQGYNAKLAKGLKKGGWVKKLQETFPDLFRRPDSVLQNQTVYTATTLTTVAILKMLFCSLWNFAQLSKYLGNPSLLVLELVKKLLVAAKGPVPTVIRKILEGKMDQAAAASVASLVVTVGAQLSMKSNASPSKRAAVAAAAWASMSESGQSHVVRAFLAVVVMESYEDFIRNNVLGKNFPVPSRFLAATISPQVVRILLWIFIEGPQALAMCPSITGSALTVQAFVEVMRKMGISVAGTVTIASVWDFVRKTPSWFARKNNSPARSPVAKSPVAKSPVAKSPVAKSPVAKSPVAKSPVAKSKYNNLSLETILVLRNRAEMARRANIKRQLVKTTTTPLSTPFNANIENLKEAEAAKRLRSNAKASVFGSHVQNR
jgi:hypothetical protein